MSQAQTHKPRRAPQFKSRLTELRSLSHSLAAELGYCPEARRHILMSLVGDRYARNLTEEQLEFVTGWMQARLNDKFPLRPYMLEPVSCEDALAVL